MRTSEGKRVVDMAARGATAGGASSARLSGEWAEWVTASIAEASRQQSATAVVLERLQNKYDAHATDIDELRRRLDAQPAKAQWWVNAAIGAGAGCLLPTIFFAVGLFLTIVTTVVVPLVTSHK